MTISWRVQQQFFTPASVQKEELIRLPPTLLYQNEAANSPQKPKPNGPSSGKPPSRARSNLWTLEEHERFLHGLEMFRHGPWKRIAAVVGTKTTRQTMTHAQKYRQKIERRQRVAEAIASMETATWSPPPTTIPFLHAPCSAVPVEWDGWYTSALMGTSNTTDPDAVGALSLDPDMGALLQDLIDIEADAPAYQCVV